MSLGAGGPAPGSFGTTGRGPRLLSGGGRRATADLHGQHRWSCSPRLS